MVFHRHALFPLIVEPFVADFIKPLIYLKNLDSPRIGCGAGLLSRRMTGTRNFFLFPVPSSSFPGWTGESRNGAPLVNPWSKTNVPHGLRN